MKERKVKIIRKYKEMGKDSLRVCLGLTITINILFFLSYLSHRIDEQEICLIISSILFILSIAVTILFKLETKETYIKEVKK